MEYLMSVEEALERILSHFTALGVEERPILEALGQTLAEDIYASFQVPPMDNSAMDGYALQAADIAGASESNPVVLEVTGLVAAGHVPEASVRPGATMRIMTGAPIPEGADTVVPFEDTDEVAQRTAGVLSSQLKRIGIMKKLPLGANVRPAGGDIKAGDLILKKGEIVHPAALGVLASLGRQTVSVIRRPKVAILATGDELVEPGKPLGPGQIYDSNTFSIAAQVLQCGGIPVALGIARDNIDDLMGKIEAGLDADFFITSAGVSTGEYDLVKDVLTQRGWMDFWRVRLRPGKPLAFGVLDGPGSHRVPHLGLPGNPVSSMVAFDQFARPAILKMMGRERWERPRVSAILEETVANDDDRRFYARGVLTKREGEYYARLTGPQGSNILTSMATANCLIIIPEYTKLVEKGQRVTAQILEGNEELLG